MLLLHFSHIFFLQNRSPSDERSEKKTCENGLIETKQTSDSVWSKRTFDEYPPINKLPLDKQRLLSILLVYFGRRGKRASLEQIKFDLPGLGEKEIEWGLAWLIHHGRVVRVGSGFVLDVLAGVNPQC